MTYNTGHPGYSGYLRSLIHYTISPAALYDQLTNFLLIVYGSPLNLAKDPSDLAPTVWNDLPLDTPLPIPLSAISRHSSLHSLTNYYIIIIINIINSLEWHFFLIIWHLLITQHWTHKQSTWSNTTKRSL